MIFLYTSNFSPPPPPTGLRFNRINPSPARITNEQSLNGKFRPFFHQFKDGKWHVLPLARLLPLIFFRGFHFILSKIVDWGGLAIFVAYCTLKTRWKYDRPPTDITEKYRESVETFRTKLPGVEFTQNLETENFVISWTYLFKDRSPWNVVGGILNGEQKCFHAIFPSTSFSFFCISLHHLCF